MNPILDFIAAAPDFPDAKCADVQNPDDFFVEDKKELQKMAPTLMEICISCRHRIECRDYAIRERIEYGFWGGTTPQERKKLMPKRSRKGRRSNTGVKAAQLRAAGLRWTEIGAELNISATAAQKAWARYMEDQKAAS